MNRLPSLAWCVVWAALISCFAVNRTQAQAAPSAAPQQEQAQKPASPPSEKDAEKWKKSSRIHSLQSLPQRCRRG